MLNIIIGTFVMFVTLSIPYSVGKLINKLIIKPHDKDTIHGNVFVGCGSLVIGGMGLFVLYNIGRAVICNISW